MSLTRLYGHSLALLTDLYQLTMAYGYWKTGLADRPAVFHLTFREAPFGGRYAIACGLNAVVDFVRQLRFADDDLEYLAGLRGADERPLFEAAFLEYLAAFRLRVDLDAIPEGTLVFAQQPLLRVCGPLLDAQILETPLLTLVNFPTLLATKATRIVRAAGGAPVLEFGLRRAQGIDGGVTASRASYVGGCTGTSNVLAGKLFDIPVRGTHAHSWVMAFGDELLAFERYAEALPGNSIFLVDTYDTLRGVQHAIQVGRQLRGRGSRLLGVRLDSGDLASLSRTARRMLDEAGFTETRVLVSGDLDEHRIAQMLADGARTDVYGVGTRLATAYDQPALGGVYKLAALQDERGEWSYRVKLSEQEVKSSDPGILQVRRLRDAAGRPLADVIYDQQLGFGDPPSFFCGGAASPQADRQVPRVLPAAAGQEDLLLPIFRAGRCVYQPPTAAQARDRVQEQLAAFDPRLFDQDDPYQYPVGREARLETLRAELIATTRRRNPS